MKTSALGTLIRLVEKHLFPKAHGTAAMNGESETVKDPAQESAAPLRRKMAEPPANADFLFYYEGSKVLLRPQNPTARKHLEDNVAEYAQWLVRFYLLDGSTILLGPGNGAFFVKPGCSLYSLTTLADTLVKRSFTVVKDDKVKKAEPPADADFLVYHESPRVLIRPQNLSAREFLQTTVAEDAARWVNGALAVKDASVVPIAHKLVAAGFVVVGESALVHTAPRLYVNDEKWWLYTGGRHIPPKIVKMIGNGTGTPN